MENMIISFNVVVPLFLNILLGYILKITKLWDEHTLKVMNKAVFKSFLPILLFYNVYNTDLKSGLNPKLMIFASSCVFIMFLLLCLLVPLFENENKRRGVIIQGIFRSNFVLFGLPVAISLFGEENIGIPSILIATIVPTYNFLAVITLEIFRGGKINIKKIIKGIITNPLIISSLAGILMIVLDIKLPYILDKTASDLSKVATPLALAILGGSFEFKSISAHAKQLIFTVFGKLILAPAIFLPIAVALGFRGIELGTLITMLAAPGAVSSFTMAEQMGADGDLAGQIVVFTSLFSIITMFFWIFINKQLGYI